LVAVLLLAWAWSSLAAQSVTLAWDPSPDSNVTSYVLYYGQASRHWTASTNVGNTNLATVTGLAAGTWFFVVTARDDTTGLESDPSNEVWCTLGPQRVTPPKLRSLSLSAVLESAPTPVGPWVAECWIFQSNMVARSDRAFYRFRGQVGPGE
jgi:hypothetical protein